MADQRRAIIDVVDAHAASLMRSIIVTPDFKAHLIEKKVFTPEVIEAIFKVILKYRNVSRFLTILFSFRVDCPNMRCAFTRIQTSTRNR